MKDADCLVVRRISEHGCPPLTVTPHAESPVDFVSLLADSPESVNQWGNVTVTFSPEFARSLGKALIACADEVRATK